MEYNSREFSDRYYMNLQTKDFEEFKNDLNQKDKKGAYRLVSIQKLAYRITVQAIKNGHDVEGNKFTEEEIEMLKLVVKQLVDNYDSLKDEYDYNSDQA